MLVLVGVLFFMSLHCTNFTCIPIGTNTLYMTGVTGRSSTVLRHPFALRLPCMQDRFWYVKLYNKTLNETRKLIPPEQQHNILSLNTFRTNHTYTSKYMYNAKHPSLKKLESSVDYQSLTLETKAFFTMCGYSYICIYMCMNLNMWREKMQFEMTSCLCVVSPGILLLYRFSFV